MRFELLVLILVASCLPAGLGWVHPQTVKRFSAS
jgi:hypothetical protein